MAFAPELVASVGHEYLYSDKTVAQIAFDHKICVRDIARLREREGWPKRNERIHGVPTAVQALRETEALLAARGAESADGNVGRAKLVPAQAGTSVPAASTPAQPGDEDRAGTAQDAPLPALPAVERIERLVHQELAAEETVRRQLGPLARTPADAERSARTLATLTQTLHALARLRGGLAPDSGLPHDDMPRDIDEFRRELARRIRVFVQSRTGGCVCNGDRPADGSRVEP